MGKLNGKKALVTGGSKGIGSAIAIEFAKEGADIAINYLSDEINAEQTVREIQKIGRKAKAIKADINHAGERTRIVKETLEFLGEVDILVNNAGILNRGLFLNIEEEEYDKVLNLNLKSPFFLTQLFCKHLIQQNKGGCIINISSISDRIVSEGLVHYECSKAGLTMFTKAIASEMAQYKIRVNAICPGLIATSLNYEQWHDNPIFWRQRIQNIPLGRAGNPSDVVGAAVFLASDDSSWMTGSRIVVDGGLSHNAQLSIIKSETHATENSGVSANFDPPA